MPPAVVVVGAGVIGSAIAAELSRRGATVTVLEAGRPGRGTSGATFAWTNSNDNDPQHYHEFRVEAMVALQRFADESRVKDWYHVGGNVEWRADQDGIKRLQDKVNRRLELGYPVEWITRDQLLQLEPDLDTSLLPDDGIAYFPTEGWVDTPVFVSLLLHEARNHGAQIIEDSRITGFEVAGDRIHQVVAGNHRYDADAVVNCAGPDADAVAALAGLELPLSKVPGLIVATEPVPVSIGRVIHTPDTSLRPDGGGRLALGGARLDKALDTDSDEIRRELVEPVLADAERWFPAIQGLLKVEAMRVGVRPIPKDRLPVLGPSGRIDNFFHAVTHGGVTLSIRLAEVVAGQVIDHTEPDGFDLYRIDSADRSGSWSLPRV